MKNELNGNNAVRKVEVDLTGDVLEILKTMVLFERAYGVGYLVQVLKGDEEAQWKQEQHAQFETFGALSRFTKERIKNIIHLTFELGFIEPENPMATVIRIAEGGKKFLSDPKEIKVNWNRIKLSYFDYKLRIELAKARWNSAKKANVPPFKVYSDFAIERLIRTLPKKLSELKQVPGITPYIAETYGEKILNAVAESEQLRYEDYLARARKEVKTPTFQQTKKLFLEGKTPAQIAAEKGISERTVRGYLEKLHLCGEVDLKPWIEQVLDSKSLYKGAEYFRKVESPRLKEAYETLGLDYETLRFCRLYVSDVSVSYEEIAIPA